LVTQRGMYVFLEGTLRKGDSRLAHFSNDGGFIDSWKVNPEGQNAMRINHVVFVSKEVPADTDSE